VAAHGGAVVAGARGHALACSARKAEEYRPRPISVPSVFSVRFFQFVVYGFFLGFPCRFLWFSRLCLLGGFLKKKLNLKIIRILKLFKFEISSSSKFVQI
jgi:hypothetical protein